MKRTIVAAGLASALALVASALARCANKSSTASRHPPPAATAKQTAATRPATASKGTAEQVYPMLRHPGATVITYTPNRGGDGRIFYAKDRVTLDAVRASQSDGMGGQGDGLPQPGYEWLCVQLTSVNLNSWTENNSAGTTGPLNTQTVAVHGSSEYAISRVGVDCTGAPYNMTGDDAESGDLPDQAPAQSVTAYFGVQVPVGHGTLEIRVDPSQESLLPAGKSPIELAIHY